MNVRLSSSFIYSFNYSKSTVCFKIEFKILNINHIPHVGHLLLVNKSHKALLHLLFIAVLQKLHVAATLTVGPAQCGAAMLLQQVRRWWHAAAQRIHPSVDVICDIAARNPPNGSHRHAELFASLQHLSEREELKSVIDVCWVIHVRMLTFSNDDVLYHPCRSVNYSAALTTI